MERNNLIPSVDTNDLEPKTPWEVEKEHEITLAAEKLHQEEEQKKQAKPERSLFVKSLLAILIVGGIIGLGILLPIKLVPRASTFVSNVFNSASSSTSTNSSASNSGSSTNAQVPVITPDKVSIKSEEVVNLKWTGPVRNDGEYTLTFPCSPGVAMILVAANSTKYAVPCDAPFKFTSIDNTLTLAIQSREKSVIEVPLNFSFTTTAGAVTHLAPVTITVINNFPETADAQNNGNTSSNTSGSGTTGSTGSQAQTGSITTGPGHTIFDSANPQAGNTNTNTGTTQGTTQSGSNTASNSGYTSITPSQPAAPKYYGKSDLITRVIATGILDKTTGTFIPTNSFNGSDRVAVQFEVVNIGTNYSGAWNFNAILPNTQTQVYQSAQEAALAPNARIVFTLGFDNIKAGNATMIIDADPGNAVSESNETNNTATVNFGTSGSTATNSGNADLKTTLIDVGRMSGNTFVSDSSITVDDRAALQFRVTNVGGMASGSWKFEADMTRDGADATYRSSSQTSLAAGQSTVVTIAFDRPSEGRQSFDITVDPDHDISDANRGNNEITASITVND